MPGKFLENRLIFGEDVDRDKVGRFLAHCLLVAYIKTCRPQEAYLN